VRVAPRPVKNAFAAGMCVNLSGQFPGTLHFAVSARHNWELVDYE